jgi:hypothetical protein
MLFVCRGYRSPGTCGWENLGAEFNSTQLCTCTTSTISNLAKVATKIKAVAEVIQTINFNVNTFFTAAQNKFGW